MLNMTLLAQAVHFGVAYIILDRIFLRFGARLIIAEKKQIEAVQTVIAQTTKQVAEKSAQNERAWQQDNKLLMAKVPSIDLSNKLPLVRDISCNMLTLSEVEINNLVTEAKHAIVERLAHD